MKNSLPCRTAGNESEHTKKHFAKYTSRVSRMNAWMIEEELARKLADYDQVQENAEDDLELKERTMREIEILQARKEKKGPNGNVEFQSTTKRQEANQREIEVSQIKNRLHVATNWELAQELDKYKGEYNSCLRKIGLMDFYAKGDHQKFQALTSERDQKERTILLLKEEMQRRGVRV